VTYVDIIVQFKVNGQKIKARERGVRLNDDSVQISASNLAYGLVEEAWGLVDDE
jgi:hypothetical protein